MSNGAKASFFQRGFGSCRSLIIGPLVILLIIPLLSGCPEVRQKAQVTNYQQTQGLRVQVRDLRVEPSAISPGQQLVVKANYVVMAPALDAEIEVVETLTALTYDDKPEQGKRLLTLPRKISIKPGTWQYAGELALPKEGLRRKLQITFRIEASDKSERQADQKSQEISVAMTGASLPAESSPVNASAQPPVSSQAMLNSLS